MTFFGCYDKKIIEPFAKDMIAASYCANYSGYTQPTDPDNFDFLSPDGLHALEVVTVIPENELNAYEYKKQQSKGKRNLKLSKIRMLKLARMGVYYFIMEVPLTRSSQKSRRQSS